ncbi:hypothetical protein IHE44_0011451 [Lamprotornis superbus]|uniref:Uncharacterized protein n=1 Tax=Lamprotornis superbus TaxID=245042 RepID=A0A835TRU9_9PASS|nr:hypothetical protein IHE44_0011451 [Lamprotornis superbus]
MLNVDVEFFKRVRSSYYVVSGNDAAAEEPSRAVLDSLLEGKAQWESNMQVTLIPTHDSEVMREWYQETHEKQQDLNIMVLASSSTVVMQDESFPACKIELNRKNVDVEFFKRVRSSYYVVSGNDSAAEEPSRGVLESLLEGKAQWDSNMQVGSSLVFLPGNVIFSGKQLQEARVPLKWAAAARDRSSQQGTELHHVEMLLNF